MEMEGVGVPRPFVAVAQPDVPVLSECPWSLWAPSNTASRVRFPEALRSSVQVTA